jgi:hypothetical protein
MKKMLGSNTLVLLVASTLLVTGSRALAQSDSVTRKAAIKDSVNKPKEGFQYDPDAGLQYKKGDFKWTTWAFAERLFAGGNPAAWRRVRQGMDISLPAYPLTIKNSPFRTDLIYEVDFTDNNFFRDSKRFKIWENLFLTFQNAKDPNKFRLLFGENTHILSREDNLSSGNLPTINRSLILEQSGSTNSFGTQWGFQVQSQVSPKTFLQASLQDNRGSLNQDHPSFQFWNGVAGKITESFIQSSDKSAKKLNAGFAVDETRNIKNKFFTLNSGILQNTIGSIPASGNKLTFEHNLDYTNKIGKHFYILEYEGIYSTYSDQHLQVRGGYAQVQFQLFDGERLGELVPFIRYDLVNLANPFEAATEQAFKMGLNYNLPFSHKLASFHIEYARHSLTGSPVILNTTMQHFDEFRLELRVNATRYVRF